MKTSETLNAAADDLEVNGWTKGNRGLMPAGPHCILGAIAYVTGAAANLNYGGDVGFAYTMSETVESAAGRAMCQHLGDNPGHPDAVWRWNDNHNRTAEQVIATLRAAAVIEAAREAEVDAITAAASAIPVSVVTPQADVAAVGVGA